MRPDRFEPVQATASVDQELGQLVWGVLSQPDAEVVESVLSVFELRSRDPVDSLEEAFDKGTMADSLQNADSQATLNPHP